MAASQEATRISIPRLPAAHEDFIQHVAAHADTPIMELIEPYNEYDAEMRKVFAQEPDHPAAKKPNVIPVFTGHEEQVRIRARNLEAETEKQADCYIMPLKTEDRRLNGSPAIVQSFRQFATNFSVFSESSLADLDWSNVVVAGSAVVTSLLAVPEKHSGSKRALRRYYHEQLAPASDVDLFLYGLNEDQAIDKIKQIERNVRDALLVETTTIRTKNAITIASKHPVRHVQIVLRIYKSISEILTGFDVDCSCVAYDGKQVYASPRAVAALMTQVNTVDLTRRSPSYENRLSKYAHRGFEVYWPSLDRSRIDPTIFERSFRRTEGLSRLLILEKLPTNDEREAYTDQRRAERGRPAANRSRMNRRQIRGNIKDDHEDEVAEWVDEDVSDYHTFTIPYGPQFHARKIEKLLYTKDMLLNAEWNKPKDREVNLHRHPAFFGNVEDVIQDCCGFCPKPATVEEEEVSEEESKVYVSGDISFMKDDPGRQAIGSFNPITTDDWTTMAYVGDTALLCQAIVDGDLEYVQNWLDQDGNDPNTRDYTGRTPLHLAVVNSTLDVVQALVDGGARLVARLVDGRTALHLAAMRGDCEMVSALLKKSAANEEEEEKKVDARRAARKAAKEGTSEDSTMQEPTEDRKDVSESSEEDSDIEMVEATTDDNVDATTENSVVNIKSLRLDADDQALANEDAADDEPDVYDIDVVAWDTAISPLHLAIIKGHVDVVRCLVQEFGADVLLPIKLYNDHDRSARAAILTLVLALQLPTEKAQEMARTLIELGASSAQASIDQSTTLQYCVADTPDLLDTLADADAVGVKRAINHLSLSGYMWSTQVSSPLMTAIAAKDSDTALRLLASGAKPEINFSEYMKAYSTRHDSHQDSKQNRRNFEQSHEQPVFTAVKWELPVLAKNLIENHGIDANCLAPEGYRVINDEHFRRYTEGQTLLDNVQKKLQALRDYKFQADEPAAPTPLGDDSDYLSSYEQDSYALWSAKKQLDGAKTSYQKELERYKEDVEKSQDRTGVDEKQKAVERMMTCYEQLETTLLERSAKSFYDLHPQIERPEKREPFKHNYHREPPKPFQVEFNFQLGDLTEETQAKYEQLFQASWEGDIKAVKQLTLTSWETEEREDQPPLKIAVRDQHGMSPFSIAVVNGHYELAGVIMTITQAQHMSRAQSKKRRYAVDAGNSDDDDEEGLALHSEIVDDDFTIENIGEISMQVNSHVTPIALLLWPLPAHDFASSSTSADANSRSKGFSYFGPRKSTTMAGKRTNTGSIKLPSPPQSSEGPAQWQVPLPTNLFQLAIYNNDHELLALLLKTGKEYQGVGLSEDEEAMKQTFAISEADFEYAIQANHPRLIEMLVIETGAGIPLTKLAQKHGAELKEKPRYYQGLSVHGTKRKDWADAAGQHHLAVYPARDYSRPPLLSAAFHCSISSLEWLFSDAVIRSYREFAELNEEDKRVRQLQLSKSGFEGVVAKFLNTRSSLSIHCCLLASLTTETGKVLKYLIEANPDNLESKSKEGFTPLQIAFQLFRCEEAKMLIDAGADQTCRDKAGKNLVHSLLTLDLEKQKDVEKFNRMLNIIDERLLPGMFTERCTGSLTPLHYWLRDGGRCVETEVAMLDEILRRSGGKELDLISGDGSTPLHHLVSSDNFALVEVLLAHDPTLLNRENATGRTPFEIAEDDAVAEECCEPPPMPGNHSFTIWRARRFALNSHWSEDVVSRSPKSFVEGSDVKPLSSEEIWTLLQQKKAELDREGNGKRRLVTLNEANEVARRLAGRQTRRAHVVGGEENEDDELDWRGDEVQELLRLARPSLS